VRLISVASAILTFAGKGSKVAIGHHIMALTEGNLKSKTQNLKSKLGEVQVEDGVDGKP
jgi:hypothetical protein